VVFDVLGTYLGLLFGARRQLLQFNRPLALGLLAVAVASFFAIAVPIAATAWDTLQAQRQFPLLAGFSSRLELGRFKKNGVRIVNDTLEVTFAQQRYAGFYLDDFPRDWSGYRALVVDVFNPDSTPLQLICRVHDRRHNQEHYDRYNGLFVLPAGFSTIRIELAEIAAAPRQRRLAIDAVAGFGCFRAISDQPRRLFVNAIRLE
jgi:hypothetical protein